MTAEMYATKSPRRHSARRMGGAGMGANMASEIWSCVWGRESIGIDPKGQDGNKERRTLPGTLEDGGGLRTRPGGMLSHHPHWRRRLSAIGGSAAVSLVRGLDAAVGDVIRIRLRMEF